MRSPELVQGSYQVLGNLMIKTCHPDHFEDFFLIF